MQPDGAKVVRNVQRLTKDRAKALVAAGLQRAVALAGIDEVALAGGCSRRCIEKSLAHDTLPSIDILANALDADPTILDELLAAKGLSLCFADASAANDLTVAAGVIDAMGELVKSRADGNRDHNETIAVARLLRPHMPAIEAIMREADVLRVGAMN